MSIDTSQITSSILNSLNASEQVKLSEILDEYMEKLARGEAPRQQSLIDENPQLSEPLRIYLEKLEELQDFLVRPAATMDLSGQTLDDFQLIRPIGRGGMGVVYQAWQASLQRHVAVKLLPSASFNVSKLEERFEIESRAAAMLEHPHIVPIYATGRAEGIRYYAMRLVDGPSLDEVILDAQENATNASLSSISVGELKDTLAQFANLADALQSAHELGIIHRDIKPSNIMQDGSGKLWITDFGLARIVNSSAITRTGEMIGTMRYMSPEQALGNGEAVDHRSDIYSLAATLYERITLRPLIEGDEGSELLGKIAKATPPKLRIPQKRYCRSLEIVLQRAMTKHKDDRYASAGAFRDDLRRILDGVAITTRRPSSIVRTIRWCAEHTTFVMSACALMFVFSCALMFTSWKYRGEYLRAQANKQSESDAVQSLGMVTDKLAMRPGVDDIREEGALKTLEHSRDLANQSRSDMQLQANFAAAHTRMGSLEEEQGNLNAAIEYYQNAENIYIAIQSNLGSQTSSEASKFYAGQLDNQNHLAMAVNLSGVLTGEPDRGLSILSDALVPAKKFYLSHPDDKTAVLQYALTKNNYATLLMQNKQKEQAAIQLKEALVILQGLSAKGLHSLLLTRTLAAAHHNFGQLNAKSNPNVAISEFEKAIALRIDIAGDDENRFRVAPELVSSYLELGTVALDRGNNAMAINSFNEAAELSRPLIKIAPGQQQVLQLNATASTNLAIALCRSNRTAEALVSINKGIDSFSKLVELNKANDSLAEDLALAFNNRARILIDLGRLSDGMLSYEKAESILSAQHNSSALVQLQRVYESHLKSAREIGNHPEAVQLESILSDFKYARQQFTSRGAAL